MTAQFTTYNSQITTNSQLSTNSYKLSVESLLKAVNWTLKAAARGAYGIV